MNDETTFAESKLQWHPAFFAEIQIEFEGETEELFFQNEVQLGTRPKEVDVLITKRNPNYQVKKNIGKFFRKYNLLEYKPPGDTLTIDDFYKICGYACFYKADSPKTNERKAEEITITFVSYSYPREMIKNLKRENRYKIYKAEEGIYYIIGGIFPAQLIVTKFLSEKENFWLHNLTNNLTATQKVYNEYEKHKNNELYKSVMGIIVKANRKLFQEDDKMCQELFELFEDKLMAMAEEKAMERAMEKAMEKAMKKAKEIAMKEAKEIAMKEAKEIAMKEAEKKLEETVKIRVQEQVELKAQELAELKAQELTKRKIKEKQQTIITNLINNAHFSLEQALDILMISEEDRNLYTFA